MKSPISIFAVLGLGLALLIGAAAHAQTARVVQTCPGTAIYTAGTFGQPTIDTTGANCGTPSGGISPAPYALTPLGYQQITSLSAATALTVPTGATVAVVVPETQPVRFRDDGTNPTASVGFPLAVGQPVPFYGAAEIAALKFIEQTASAKLSINYYK